MKKTEILVLLAAGCILCSLQSAVSAAGIDLTDKEVIKTIQTRLNAEGFDGGTPDGVSGARTKQAISDYRAKEGLEAGDQIDSALFNSLMLDADGEELVQTVYEVSDEVFNDAGIKGTVDDVILYQYDLYIAASPAEAYVEGDDAQLEAAEILASGFAGRIIENEEYDYLWDTVTFKYGDLPETVSRKDDAAGVTPSLQKFLGEYETFMNEYCDFLETYDETNFTQQTQYLRLTKEYAGHTAEAEELDRDNMSEADLKYLDSVMERIDKRLESVTGAVARVR